MDVERRCWLCAKNDGELQLISRGDMVMEDVGGFILSELAAEDIEDLRSKSNCFCKVAKPGDAERSRSIVLSAVRDVAAEVVPFSLVIR